MSAYSTDTRAVRFSVLPEPPEGESDMIVRQ
jgi:hypothetical protein